MTQVRREGTSAALFLLLALHAGLILGVRTPLSENDKARWDTVWSLVEFGTFEIWPEDKSSPAATALASAQAAAAGRPEQFGTIDKVRVDGRYLSSKPPLLPCVLAAIVKPLRLIGPAFSRVDRFDARVAPAEVYCKLALLILFLPHAAAFLALFARWLDGIAKTEFAYWFCFAAAGLGTLVAGYAGSLNNHVVAAWSAGIAALLLWPAWTERRVSWGRFALAGFFAAWTAANELPAGLFALLALAAAMLICLRTALRAFVPAAAAVAVAFFAANYACFGTFAPAYAKKEFYDYPGSYWTAENAAKRSKIDALSLPDVEGKFAEGPRIDLGFAVAGKPAGVFFSPAYLCHMLVGHHGWFSLTPIWLLALLGARRWRDSGGPRGFPTLVLGLSAALVAFYWLLNTERNYGGYCHGMRWLVWLSPIWLMLLPPALDRLAPSRNGRRFALACLAVSMLSAADAMPNSWTVSWLHRIFVWHGGVGY